jgi:hypothetical protein
MMRNFWYVRKSSGMKYLKTRLNSSVFTCYVSVCQVVFSNPLCLAAEPRRREFVDRPDERCNGSFPSLTLRGVNSVRALLISQ